MSELFAKVYLDACISEVLAVLIRKGGFDAISARELKQYDLFDEDQLIYASAQGRVLVTFDKTDFYSISKKCPNHKGIIICPITSLKGMSKLAKKICEKLNTYTVDEFHQLVIWV